MSTYFSIRKLAKIPCGVAYKVRLCVWWAWWRCSSHTISLKYPKAYATKKRASSVAENVTENKVTHGFWKDEVAALGTPEVSYWQQQTIVCGHWLETF